MSQLKNVSVLLGSLRKQGISAGLGRALQKLCPADLHLQQLTIGDMPFYNQDDEAQPPVAWQAFRKSILACDALLFITPEYNRSVPAVLKNAIDVGSRPYGQSVWNGKPAAIFTFSPGNLGGFGANQHLRQSLSCLNVPTMTNEVYLSSAGKLLNEHGAIASPETQHFLSSVMESFATWIDRNRPAQV
jgi:chromate reductase